MTYEIVKNKPLPPRDRGPGRKPVFPFAKMQVGDAFCVPGDGDVLKWQRRLGTRAGQYVRKHAPYKKFATRQIDGDVWVWRTA